MAGEFFYGAGNENTQCEHCSSQRYLSSLRPRERPCLLRYSVALAEKKCHYFDIFSLASPFEFASRFHKKKSPKREFFYGAGNENRTRIKSLGSSRSTIELCPQKQHKNTPLLQIIKQNFCFVPVFCLLPEAKLFILPTSDNEVNKYGC